MTVFLIVIGVLAGIFGINMKMAGTATQTIETLLGLAVEGLLVFGFIYFGWRVGLVALFGFFVVARFVTSLVRNRR